jgi:hypothetical protein
MRHEHQLIDGETPVIHLKSSEGDFTQEHRITIGSEDGNDALSDMTDDRLAEHLQALLNQKKADHETILTNRKRAAQAAKSLK